MSLRLGAALSAAVLLAGAAAAAPIQSGLLQSGDPHIRIVPYAPDRVVELRVALGFALTIEFEHGERLENVTVGDSLAWQVTPAKRGDLLFVKPVKKPGLTNMTVFTNQRRYDFSLRAEDAPAAAPVYDLRFLYPSPSPSPKAEAPVVLKPAAPAPAAPPKPVNRDYSYEGASELVPASVWDDGTFTYFAFPPGADYPAIYMLDHGGRESVINFAVRDGRVVVDKVAPGFVLRRGQAVLRIFNDGFRAPAPTDHSPRPRGKTAWPAK